MRPTALATTLLLCAGMAQAQDHAHHQMPPAQPQLDEHAQHRQPQEKQEKTTGAGYQPPVLTDADRAAAFPDLSGHDMGGHMKEDPFVWMVLADRLERREGDALGWDAQAWLGHDRNRLWLRSEGQRERGHAAEGQVEALWGRPVSPWWDVLAGLRRDIGHDGRSWLALGVQGLAPYKLEVAATAYLGEGGHSALQAEVEYELLLTNRLILQPLIEVSAYGRDDPARRIGSGLSELEAGLRLRYEIRREFAPYIGVEHGRRFGRTADFARAAGEPVDETRWVIGIRAWL